MSGPRRGDGVAASKEPPPPPPPHPTDDRVVLGPAPAPPALDRKRYRQVLLPNGLRCLLIEDVLAARPLVGPDDDEYDESDADDDTESDGGSSREDGGRRHWNGDDGSDGGGIDDGSEDDAGLRDAACCIVVGAGSMYDPPECQGLAHFLEHLLFMGSEKYPKENEYDSYVSKRGGANNAWTEWEHTSYSLEIPQDDLWGALDRLAQFFIAPLMLPSAADRELNSIESEFALHKTSDSVRWQALLCATARPGHPLSSFAWGNLRSLRDIPAQCGIDPLEQLWTFYRRYYYAANMRLVLCSAYSLGVMQRKVWELFRDVPALPRQPGPLPLPVDPEHLASWAAPPYQSPLAGAGSPLECGARIYRIVPVKDRHILSLTWALPPVFAHWRGKPHDFVAHLLGHEARGSLLSHIKAGGWATQCMAGVGDDGCERASSHALFTLTFVLSEQGVRNWRWVVDATYQYIGMLRLQCRQGWPSWLFEELQVMHDLSYKYKDEMPPDELVEGIADDMAPHVNMPAAFVLDGGSRLFEFDETLVQELLDESFLPKHARIDLSSSSFGRASDFPDDTATEGIETKLSNIRLHTEDEAFDPQVAGEPNIEPMFGTVFWCSEVPDSLIQRWSLLAEPQVPSIGVGLPPCNPFMPSHFALKPLPEHDARHPLINCSLKLCVSVGKKMQWFTATPVQYNKTTNSLLFVYEGDEEQWHSLDENVSNPEDMILHVGDVGTFDQKRIKFRVLSVAHPGRPRMIRSDSESDMENNVNFPLIPPVLSPSRLPQEISNTNLLKLWWLQDRHFHRPLAEFRAQIICAKANSEASYQATADLLIELVADALTESSYLASLCELTYSIEATNIGFYISVSGFDDNLLRLLTDVMRTIFSFRDSPDTLPEAIPEGRFQACFEVLERKYKNAGLNASGLCGALRLHCICPAYWSANEKLQALSSIACPEAFAKVAQSLLQDFAIEAFYHGNITKTDATTARDAVLQLVGSGAPGLPRKQYPPQSVLRSPVAATPTVVRVPSLDPTEPNTAVELYIQFGKDNLRERVLLDLLMHIFEEPLYDQLRTKEQIGYDVSCDTRWSYGVMGIAVHVVTNVKSADATVERVMTFLQEQRTALEKLEDFSEYVVGLAKRKLTSFDSLTDSTNHYWGEIRDGTFQWESWRDEAVVLQTVQKEEILEIFDKVLGLNNALAVQVIGNGEGVVSQQRPDVAPDQARDFMDCQIAQFRRSCKNQKWGRINSKLF